MARKGYREMLRVAGERAADLIVMGVHGRSPIDIMLFGSTTQHVVGRGLSGACHSILARGQALTLPVPPHGPPGGRS